uniref:glutamate synthase (ferredoxin) n=1 Tax=Parascaris equorum TaxID=6256 RepID=A0A914S7Y9_PAREQ
MGQFTPDQLYRYYSDLTNPEFVTHIAIVHSRFSTNTLPSWCRAQPNRNILFKNILTVNRMVAHNGEINTLRGNINFMHAREGVMKSKLYGDDLHKLYAFISYPVVEKNLTDSGCFDNVFEFLVRAGNRSLPEAAMTMVPEAWEKDELFDFRAFIYANTASTIALMDPFAMCRTFVTDFSPRWSKISIAALMAFSDGRYVGAILDRNGLRPARYYLTDDDHLFLSSEVGVIDLPISCIIKKVGGFVEPH